MTFVCKHCGAEFEGNKGETHRIFCSNKCYLAFKKANKGGICDYNTAVTCNDRCACSKCGWNPKVEAKRKETYRG